jgi:hypothetical protein
MKRANHPDRAFEIKFVGDGDDIFVVRNGVKIAKRG